MLNLYPVKKSNSFVDPFEDFTNSFSASRWSMNTDIRDLGNAFELSVELPGYKKEDIKLELDHENLVIKAERHDDNEYIRRERFYGAVSRSFDVSGTDVENIEAKYEDGVLVITLPKKEALTTRSIEIK